MERPGEYQIASSPVDFCMMQALICLGRRRSKTGFKAMFRASCATVLDKVFNIFVILGVIFVKNRIIYACKAAR